MYCTADILEEILLKICISIIDQKATFKKFRALLQ